jgi:D-lactate dehydrogenase
MFPMVFLEVDTEDHAHVARRFPDVTIRADPLQGDALVAACKDAEIVSCFIYSAFPREVLARLPKLKLLCTRSVGWNHIDLAACSERGIVVCNVPDYGSHVIAEHVFALLLGTLRHIADADRRVERGEFDYHGLRGVSLRGKTIGIVGTGKIGRRVAEIAHGFGMRILAVDKCRVLELQDCYGVEYVDLSQLLGESDMISLHVPVLPETLHMIDAKAFAAMKQGVILVNTARGELIDSRALLAALEDGKVRYALLDVLEHERNFTENRALIEHRSVVTTPHIAFYSEESMRNMYDDVFRSIEQWKSGKRPDHEVEPKTLVCDLPGVRK